MATKKQRKRSQKERRHEYETVWVDADGNQLDEAPDDAPATTRERRTDAKKPEKKRPQARATRTPLPPSWKRAARRAGLVSVAVLVFVYLAGSKVKGAARVYGAFELAAIYAALFTPLMYYIDKFAYRRWQQKAAAAQPKKR